MSLDLANALEMVCRTDPGRMRSQNEDALVALPGCGLAILADGMGGYNAGEVASGMTVTLLAAELEKLLRERPPQAAGQGDASALAESHLREQIAEANAAVYRAAEAQPQYQGMGTTLVVALFFDNRLLVAHVGDSRCYRWREGDLQAITRDHSFLQDQIDSGLLSEEEARYSLNRNLVTRAIGIDDTVDAEIHEHLVLPGDIYLLCSDGLNDMIDDAQIARTLSGGQKDLAATADRLVGLANEAGGQDNISVILIRVMADYHAPRGWFERFAAWLK